MGNQVDLIDIPKQRIYSGVWVTWATRKSNYIAPEFYEHLAGSCVKYHGYGIDDTLTEVFYCQ